MSPRRLIVLSLLLLTSLSGAAPRAGSVVVTDLLDAYAAGRFADVVETLGGITDFEDILKQLRRDGPAWVEAGGARRAQRELAAATFALEAARVGQWHGWKMVVRQPRMCAGIECVQPPNVLSWKPPPLLIEWGCARFRADQDPRPIERWWQLAALAVAQRSEDTAFLVGDPDIGRGIGSAEIVNTQDEIKHLDHVRPRFGKEMRFVLAEGIARDRVWPEDAVQAYTALQNDPDVGGEALMRLGAMKMPRQSQYRFRGEPVRETPAVEQALELFARAETRTRDPYVVHLARYFTGQLLAAQGRMPEAEAAYRGAVTAIPHAQSATIALASIVFRDGRRSEAGRLVAGMLAASPRPIDPWRSYVHADDRFWPRLVGKLREEILR